MASHVIVNIIFLLFYVLMKGLHNPILKALKLQKEFLEPRREVSIPHGA
jgi:hypothetical protein